MRTFNHFLSSTTDFLIFYKIYYVKKKKKKVYERRLPKLPITNKRGKEKKKIISCQLWCRTLIVPLPKCHSFFYSYLLSNMTWNLLYIFWDGSTFSYYVLLIQYTTKYNSYKYEFIYSKKYITCSACQTGTKLQLLNLSHLNP